MSDLLEVPIDSHQRVELGTPAGKKFLQRVTRDNAKLSYDSGWRMYARASDGWRLMFWRDVKGEIGDGESRITVATDYIMSVNGKRGSQVKSFSDCESVIVRDPTGIHLSDGSAGYAAKLLMDGARLTVECSSGSTHSSRHGLAFYSLSVEQPRFQYVTITLGGETICKDGDVLTSGAVDLR